MRRAGVLISIDAAREELVAGDDELADWARAHRDFFLPVDQLAVQNFAPLSAWAASRNYTPAALREFNSDQADFMLVAHAAGHGDVVVTNEQPTPQARRRIKIPDACVAMDVETVDIFTVMRGAGVALQLDGGAGIDATRESAAPMLPGLG